MRFLGRLNERQMSEAYGGWDFLICTSEYETGPLVALEAMAAHVPVVVSNAGGLAEVVQHDVTGTVTFSGDLDSLAWGIARVLKNPGFARHMADAAYERLKTVFDWDVLAKQTQVIYSRIWEEYKTSEFSRGAKWV